MQQQERQGKGARERRPYLGRQACIVTAEGRRAEAGGGELEREATLPVDRVSAGHSERGVPFTPTHPPLRSPSLHSPPLPAQPRARLANGTACPDTLSSSAPHRQRCARYLKAPSIPSCVHSPPKMKSYQQTLSTPGNAGCFSSFSAPQRPERQAAFQNKSSLHLLVAWLLCH